MFDHPDLYILRHGEAIWNRRGWYQGRNDSPCLGLPPLVLRAIWDTPRPNAEAAMSQNEMDHHNRSDCKSDKKWLQGNLKKRILATSGRSCLREVA